MDLVSIKLICGDCGKSLPIVVPNDRPEQAREAATKLGWTFEHDEVNDRDEEFCPECSEARQRLNNEGGPAYEAGSPRGEVVRGE